MRVALYWRYSDEDEFLRKSNARNDMNRTGNDRTGVANGLRYNRNAKYRTKTLSFGRSWWCEEDRIYVVEE